MVAGLGWKRVPLMMSSQCTYDWSPILFISPFYPYLERDHFNCSNIQLTRAALAGRQRFTRVGWRIDSGDRPGTNSQILKHI